MSASLDSSAWLWGSTSTASEGRGGEDAAAMRGATMMVRAPRMGCKDVGCLEEELYCARMACGCCCGGACIRAAALLCSICIGAAPVEAA